MADGNNIRGLPSFVDEELDNLRRRGRKLFDALCSDDDPLEIRALALEAARMKDRLDQLDLVLAGDVDTWLEIAESRGRGECVVIVDNALGQARLYAGTLRQTIAGIHELRGGASESEGGETDALANL